MHTHVPIPLPLKPPSHSPYPTPPGHRKALRRSPCAMLLLPTSQLFYLQQCIYVDTSLTSPQLCPSFALPPHVLKSIFYVYLLFIYLFLAALGLRCYTRAFFSCGEPGLLYFVVRGLLIAVASFVVEHGPQSMWASVVVAHRLSICGSQGLECRLSSCGAWAQLLCGMWDLPRPWLEPMSPALAGGFLTTVPPGRSHMSTSLFLPCNYVHQYLFFFFKIPYICVSTLYLFFSFSLTSLCMTDSRSIHLTTNNSVQFLFMAE